MLTLSQYRDFISKTAGIDASNAYIGGINDDDINVIGIYNLKPTGQHKPLSGLKCYDVKGISVLVHGSKSKSKTEALAHSVYNALNNVKNGVIGTSRIIAVQTLQDEPVDVGHADNGIYEYVIELSFIMEV